MGSPPFCQVTSTRRASAPCPMVEPVSSDRTAGMCRRRHSRFHQRLRFAGGGADIDAGRITALSCGSYKMRPSLLHIARSSALMRPACDHTMFSASPVPSSTESDNGQLAHGEVSGAVSSPGYFSSSSATRPASPGVSGLFHRVSSSSSSTSVISSSGRSARSNTYRSNVKAPPLPAPPVAQRARSGSRCPTRLSAGRRYAVFT